MRVPAKIFSLRKNGVGSEGGKEVVYDVYDALTTENKKTKNGPEDGRGDEVKRRINSLRPVFRLNATRD